ncbi:MAG: PIG-L deacetylase family protein, partial [Acidimicrobiales bacterium]
WVPDGSPLDLALDRTTDLGVVAHQDDLEFMALAPIGACLDDPDRWFTGVACTNGVGSVRTGRYASATDDEMAAVRRDEQRAAATIGGYSAIFQLGHPSPAIRGETDAASPRGGLVDELAEIVVAARPVNVYTHNRADKHTTHLGAGRATVEALRSLPLEQRPWRVVGIEGWRNLDWLPDDEKVLLDVSPYRELADRLAAVFVSQLEGGKRYDLAERGRRMANATLLEPRAVEEADEITYAMDLTPLVRNDDLDPTAYITAAIRRFQVDTEAAIARLHG